MSHSALNRPSERHRSSASGEGQPAAGTACCHTRSKEKRPPSSGVDPGSTIGSQPMWAAPWTLFWPRNGFTPLPGLPTLPVSSARFTRP